MHEMILQKFSFVSTHNYLLLMDDAIRTMQRATTSFLHHPFQNFSQLSAHSVVILHPQVQIYIFLD